MPDPGALRPPSDPPSGLSAEQFEAAQAFVRAFGYRRSSGGGCEVVMWLPGDVFIQALDGWRGEPAAVAHAAEQIARRVLERGAPAHSRPLTNEAQRV